MRTFVACLLFSALTLCGQPAQVILLRHAEKPGDTAAMHLSPRGKERARALVALLGKRSKLTTNAPVAALYATRVTGHGHSLRTGETLASLARELGLPVDTAFDSEDYQSLAASVLKNSAYHGRTVIICWTHHEIAGLAGALGVKPKPASWKDSTFDRLWLIKPDSSGAQLQDLPQHLLKGDSRRGGGPGD